MGAFKEYKEIGIRRTLLRGIALRVSSLLIFASSLINLLSHLPNRIRDSLVWRISNAYYLSVSTSVAALNQTYLLA
jgi:hypothetical protein